MLKIQEQGGGFLAATGGTVTTVDTNFKVHTFTGPGTFCVSAGGGPIGVADYLVVAGGGGGGSCGGGGGGAGGFRESHAVCTSGPYTASPIASSTSLPFSPRTSCSCCRWWGWTCTSSLHGT